MPRQDATLWKPDTCDCQLYIRVDNGGNVIFLDAADVLTEHQARIIDRDPTANPVLSPDHKVCEIHRSRGHSKMNRELCDVVLEENKRKNSVLVDLAGAVGADLNPDRKQIKAEILADKSLSQRDAVVKVFSTIKALEEAAQDFIREYKWEFDGERNLIVEHSSLKEEHLGPLRNKLNTVYNGKVKVK